eukprot:TRINITY_DN93077_c0_g1_i1.p1 TRINITY_DN93077_c0_g1~~TRINITY_DN93077_c0_g1_i1.p1  ORF type:complete len:358 (-),score=55.67 TRINITY_DN93077_c0_g1_i1:83-1156(-)
MTSFDAAIYEGWPARDIYTHRCKAHNCRVNSGVTKLLASATPAEFTEIDFTQNMLGSKGLLPVLDVLRLCNNLKKLTVRDNYLDNGAIHKLAEALKTHPAVTFLDVGCNPVSWTAGMSLLDLVTCNPQIRTVLMDDTHIKPSIIETIQKKAQQNQTVSKRPPQDQKGKPSQSSISTRLRALKKIFQEIAKRENLGGKVHKKNVALGYEENMRLKGLTPNLKPSDIQQLQQRCNADSHGFIDWEAFLLISLSDDISYDANDVRRLHAEFDKWDANKNGQIEPRELRTMMANLNGGDAPREEDIQQLLRTYDSDNSNSLSWDEFLIMMYEWLQGAPEVGCVRRTPATKFPKRQRPLPLT